LTCFNKSALNKLDGEGTYFNKIKATYDKPTANITEWGKTEIISSKIRNKSGCPLLRLLFSTVLEVIAKAVKRKK
jgi:hypothetical protein